MVYIWADGIYSGLRGTDDRLCVLVVIGVTARGESHFLAIEDGVRESTQSWREVLLALQALGLVTPKLATTAPRLKLETPIPCHACGALGTSLSIHFSG